MDLRTQSRAAIEGEAGSTPRTRVPGVDTEAAEKRGPWAHDYGSLRTQSRLCRRLAAPGSRQTLTSWFIMWGTCPSAADVSTGHFQPYLSVTGHPTFLYSEHHQPKGEPTWGREPCRRMHRTRRHFPAPICTHHSKVDVCLRQVSDQPCCSGLWCAAASLAGSQQGLGPQRLASAVPGPPCWAPRW